MSFVEGLEQTPFLVSINLLMLLLNLLIMSPAMHSPYKASSLRRSTSIIIIFLFCLFSFWGPDWFHYAEKFGVLINDYDSDIEDIYYYIAKYLSPNYLIFRMIVWWGGLLLLFQTIKRLNVNRDLFLLVFGCVWLIYFSYARVSLAMSILFYGSSFLIKPIKNKKALSYFLGLLLVGVAFYFHKSAIFGQLIVLVTILTNKLGKRSSILIILLFPLLIYLTRGFLMDFMSAGYDVEEGVIESYANVGQSYLGRTSGQKGLGSQIQRLLEVIPYYILAIVSIRLTGKRGHETLPKDIRFVARLLFFIVLLSSVFLFDFGLNTGILYIRFIRFAIIPASVLLSYLLEHRELLRNGRTLFYGTFVGTLYAVMYMLYCSAVN